MKATLRFALMALAAGLMLGAAPVRGQDASEPTNQQGSEVGPRELQNFNLQGTVTRPGQTQEVPTTSRPERPPAQREPTPNAVPAQPTRKPPARTPNTDRAQAQAPERDSGARESATDTQRSRTSARSVTTKLPPLGDMPSGAGDPLSPPPGATAATRNSPADSVSLVWLVAALGVLAGGALYWWLGRRREAFEGFGADEDIALESPRMPVRPEPPLPPALPRAAPVAPPSREQVDSGEIGTIGLVSTRLRPQIDLHFRPNRCLIDEENFIIEFELGLFNGGNAPARAILVEASFINAGPDPEAQIQAFYANPVGDGGRAATLAPNKPMVIRNKLVTPRSQIREFEVGGRKVFVPLVAFNALYRWSTGEGQTSLSFMLGRDIKGDKLAPFRLDMTGREFRSIGRLKLEPELRT